MECLPDGLWDKDNTGIYVADRYNASAYAYGDAFGVDLDWLVRAHRHLPQPDLNIFLDIPVEESFRRRPDRRDNYERDADMLEKVRQSYLKVFNLLGSSYIVIDAIGDQDDVFKRITEKIGRVQ